MRSSTAYTIFSLIVILVGFLLGASTGPVEPGIGRYLFFFGNATAWTMLFLVGLILYGKRGLWLLVLAPIAFYPVALFAVLKCADVGACTL